MEREVKYGLLPKWVLKLRDWDNEPMPWLDHFGIYREDGREFLISQPYELGPDKLAALLQFCGKNYLTFRVTGESPYHSNTVWLEIWPEAWSFNGT